MKYIPAGVTKFALQQAMTLKKHSPHILFVGGIAGVVTSTVLACRATLKLDSTLDNIKIDVKKSKNDVFEPYLSHHSKHIEIETEIKRNVARAYGRGCFEIGKLYAPSVLVGTASLVALTTSHVQMTRRNQALAAAYMTLIKAFDEYRARIRAELGEERELELYHNAKFETIKNEDGTETKVLKANEDGITGLYTRVFDENNRYWLNNAESTRTFLEGNQKFFNVELQTKRFVFLNDVLHHLGFPKVPEGQIVGWIYGGNGDNYIDFGIYDTINADFVINGDRSVLLDFNVDGPIYKLI